MFTEEMFHTLSCIHKESPVLSQALNTITSQFVAGDVMPDRSAIAHAVLHQIYVLGEIGFELAQHCYVPEPKTCKLRDTYLKCNQNDMLESSKGCCCQAR